MKSKSNELEKLLLEMRHKGKGYSEIAKVHKKFTNDLSNLRRKFDKEIESLKNKGEKITIKDELHIWKEHGNAAKNKELEQKFAKAIKKIQKFFHISLSKISLLTE